MLEPPVLGAAALGVLAVIVVFFFVVRSVRGHWGDGRPNTDAQRERDRAHREAQRRAPEEAARKGERYDLVVAETQYDRVPPEVRGTINGLQTFVREIPDPDGSDALAVGETIRVQVTDYGSKGTTAQARFLDRR
jgi:hypothetical protein